MTPVNVIRVADLFAGAGGMSTGLMSACRELGNTVDLVAVNHWPTAVQTHTVNHPAARHFCAPVEAVDPRVAVPGGRLHLLMAAPECVHFSTARGGRPMNDQSRASAWHLLRWLELLRVDDVLIENVPEFLTWGPLGASGRPLKAQKGHTFKAFVHAVESLNYRVEWKVLNAADYGEATTRRRLFIRARRGRKSIDWPEPTHGRKSGQSLLRHVRPWRAAREVIDWSLRGESIFIRKRPLAPATMRRIVEGLRRFGGPEIQPFIVSFYSEKDGGAPRGRSIDEPLPTIPTENRFGVAEPFIIPQFTGASAKSVNDPLGVITTVARPALIEAFLLGQHGGATARPVSAPAPTIATGGAISLIEPYLTQYYGSGSGLIARSVDEPMPAVTTKDRCALVEPIVIDGKQLDIRFRMLKPHELSAAMGFPAEYEFTGTKTDHVKQIGNAVSVRTARALCLSALHEHAQPKTWRKEKTA